MTHRTFVAGMATLAGLRAADPRRDLLFAGDDPGRASAQCGTDGLRLWVKSSHRLMLGRLVDKPQVLVRAGRLAALGARDQKLPSEMRAMLAFPDSAQWAALSSACEESVITGE